MCSPATSTRSILHLSGIASGGRGQGGVDACHTPGAGGGGISGAVGRGGGVDSFAISVYGLHEKLHTLKGKQNLRR